MKVVDSHTGGEPTRVVIEGGPDLGGGSVAERAVRLRQEHEAFCRSVCHEPRGHDAMVGALLCRPQDPACEVGVIFFNNVGPLPMCIHGTIGLVVTLAHLGRHPSGVVAIETPAGVVRATLEAGGRVAVTNVPSYRTAAGVELDVPGWGRIVGDIAWGGNWVFLVEEGGPVVERSHLRQLTDFAQAARRALWQAGHRGDAGQEVDHVEVCGPPGDPEQADSRNFILCPGGAYDRSPCGTGTSARLACLAADGRLLPGKTWFQAGILDSVFEASYERLDETRILPTIVGRAWITGESTYYFDPSDPFRHGIATLQPQE